MPAYAGLTTNAQRRPGYYPGDTLGRAMPGSTPTTAQRRPGYYPGDTVAVTGGGGGVSVRSTKAGILSRRHLRRSSSVLTIA